MKDIGDRLALLRGALKMSQADMSVVLKVTQPTYSGRETGRYEIGVNDLKILRKKYGVNLNWLITGEGEMFDETPLNQINMKLDKLIKLKSGRSSV